MNSKKTLRSSEVNDAGLAALMADVSPLSPQNSNRIVREHLFKTSVRPAHIRLALQSLAMTLACCSMAAVAAPVDLPGNYTETGTNNVAGKEWTDTANTIGTVSGTITGTASNNTAYGLCSDTSLTIGKITKDAVLTATAGGNYAYALYSSKGDITVTNGIDGSIVAEAATATQASRGRSYGIYAEKGAITLGGLNGSITSTSAGSSGNVFGIVAKNDIDITSPINGSIRIEASGTLAKGIWAKGDAYAGTGIVNLHSLGKNASITVDGTFSVYGIHSGSDLNTGELSGTISAHAKNNFAYVLTGNGNDQTVRGNVTVASIAESGRLSAITDGGYGAYAIHSAYGNVVVGNIDGSVTVASGSASTTDALSAVAIQSKWDTTLGNISEHAIISAESAGKDAYGVFVGKDGGSTAVNNVSHITVGNIAGTISASAAVGTASALYSESSVTIGNVACTARISAASSGTADVYAIRSGYLLNTGRIDGSVTASGQGDYTFALMGLGITTEIGATGTISATGPDDAAHTYALFSGTFQQNYGSPASQRQIKTYNVADSITIHAGAHIDGTVELGGSGSAGPDVVTLLGGTVDTPGTFDYALRATINTTTQAADTQVAHIRLNVGTAASPSSWSFGPQSVAFHEVDIARGSALRIGSGSTLTLNEGTVRTQNGGTLVNRGLIDGNGTISLSGNATFVTGSLALNPSGDSLAIQGTGLGSGILLAAEAGATLGTSIINSTTDTWYLSHEQIQAGGQTFLAGLVDNPGQYRFDYRLSGSIRVGEDKPVIVPDDETIHIGDGSTVTVDKNLPDNGIVLEGGTVNVTQSDKSLTSAQIKGTSGSVVMAGDQSMTWQNGESVGYSILGAGNTPAGNLIADAPGQTIVATGRYDVQHASVKEGTTLKLAGASASLGTEGGLVELNRQSTLDLDQATIQSRLEADGGSVKGSGQFNGQVAYTQSSVYVGHSPGYQNYAGGLAVDGSSRFTFYVDGFTRATASNTAAGTYSAVDVARTFSWAPGTAVEIQFGDNLLYAAKADFSLDLLNASQAETEGEPGTPAAEYTGRTDLVDTDTLKLGFSGQVLTLSGQLNTDTLNAPKRDESSRLVNALWSSTRTLESFARTSASQLDAYRTGNRNVWFAGLGSFDSMNGSDALGFDYKGGGYAVGGDYTYAKAWTTGLSFGQQFGTHESGDKLAKIKQDAIMASIYQRYAQVINDKNTLTIDGFFAYGTVDNRADGTLGSTRTHASWDDDVYNGGIRLAWTIKLDERNLLRPFTGFEFVRGDQNAITETSALGRQAYRNGAMQNWSLPVGITYQTRVALCGQQSLLPSLTLAYVSDLARKNPTIETDSLGETLRTQGANPGHSALLLQAGTQWIINEQWSANAYYDLECRNGMTNQGITAGVHYSF